jgi:hypothetical protein
VDVTTPLSVRMMVCEQKLRFAAAVGQAQSQTVGIHN